MRTNQVIRCRGGHLNVPGATALKTTEATLNLEAGTLRFGYEPETTQQAAFLIALVAATVFAIRFNAVVGGSGMFLLYFLVYAIMAGVRVRNIEFDLSHEDVWTDKQSGSFGFRVTKGGKRFFLGFLAEPELIESVEPACRSVHETCIKKQSGWHYPLMAMVCGVVIYVISKVLV